MVGGELFGGSVELSVAPFDSSSGAKNTRLLRPDAGAEGGAEG